MEAGRDYYIVRVTDSHGVGSLVHRDDLGRFVVVACGVCGREGHNAQTCSHERQRVPIPGKPSKKCECCGSRRYETHAHHTRGRADASDYLDLCAGPGGCHLLCGHDGDFQNLPMKPRVCRVTGEPSAWRA